MSRRYVAYPCMLDMVNMGDSAKRAVFRDSLVGLKAILTVNRHLSSAPGRYTLTVSPTAKYTYGTEDTIDLSKAIDIFQRTGGKEIVGACNERDGILLVLQSSQSTNAQPSPEMTVEPSQIVASTPYVPVAIKIYGGKESLPRYASAFLEATQWLRRDNPQYDGTRVLEVVHEDKEYLFACARPVSRAVPCFLGVINRGD